MAKFLDATGLDKLIALIKPRITAVEGVANKNKTDIATLNSSQNSQNTRLDALEEADGFFIKKSGGHMSGNLDMGANFVKSSGTPTVDADLTNKAYVDAQVSEVRSTASAAQTTANNAMPKSGGTFSGNVTFGPSARLNGILTPQYDTDAANKKYVDDAVSGGGGSGLTLLPDQTGTISLSKAIGVILSGTVLQSIANKPFDANTFYSYTLALRVGRSNANYLVYDVNLGLCAPATFGGYYPLICKIDNIDSPCILQVCSDLGRTSATQWIIEAKLYHLAINATNTPYIVLNDVSTMLLQSSPITRTEIR